MDTEIVLVPKQGAGIQFALEGKKFQLFPTYRTKFLPYENCDLHLLTMTHLAPISYKYTANAGP